MKEYLYLALGFIGVFIIVSSLIAIEYTKEAPKNIETYIIDYSTVREIVQDEVSKVQPAVIEKETIIPGPVREVFVEKEIPTDNVFVGCLTADILWQNPADDSLWISAVGTICDGIFTQIVPESLDQILAGREALRLANIILRYELCTNTLHKDWFPTSPQCEHAKAEYETFVR